jgi:hypothetical protein
MHISCVTNFIPIETYPEWNMYQYHLAFTPMIDSKMFRIQMIRDIKFRNTFGSDPVRGRIQRYSKLTVLVNRPIFIKALETLMSFETVKNTKLTDFV